MSNQKQPIAAFSKGDFVALKSRPSKAYEISAFRDGHAIFANYDGSTAGAGFPCDLLKVAAAW